MYYDYVLFYIFYAHRTRFTFKMYIRTYTVNINLLHCSKSKEANKADFKYEVKTNDQQNINFKCSMEMVKSDQSLLLKY